MPAEFHIKVIDDTPPEKRAPEGIGPTPTPGQSMLADAPQTAGRSDASIDPPRGASGADSSAPNYAELESKVISPWQGLEAVAKQLGFGKWLEAAETLKNASIAIRDSLDASKQLASNGGPPVTPASKPNIPMGELSSPPVVTEPPEEIVDAEIVPDVAGAVGKAASGAGDIADAAMAAGGVAGDAAASAAGPAAAAVGGAAASSAPAAAVAGVGSGAGGATAGIAGLAAAAGPAGIAIAALAATVGVAAFGVKKFADAMEVEANKLADWSVAISEEMAKSDIKREEAELRRAQRLEEDLSKFESARSDTEVALYDLGTEIKDILLRFATPLMEVIAQGVTNLTNLYKLLRPFIDAALSFLMLVPDVFLKLAKKLGDFIEWVLEKFGAGEDDDAADGFTQQFLFMGLAAPRDPFDPAPISLPPTIVGGGPVFP